MIVEVITCLGLDELLEEICFLYNNIDLIYSSYEVGKRHFEAHLWEIE